MKKNSRTSELRVGCQNEVSAPHGRINWLEYRFGIARSECRAYMPSVCRHGSVVNSKWMWTRSVAATVSTNFSWMAKPSSMADAGSLLAGTA